MAATAGAQTQWPGRTRPLCPYPQIAVYDGTGAIDDMNSFRCEKR
ncbi:MAG: tannase/feruloyl esterase family alpha/beta hydrolase [Novosphingobium sp.]